MEILNNGITFESTVGNGVFDTLTTKTVDQSDLQNDYNDVKSLIGFKDTQLLAPDQTFSSKMPGGSLAKVGEREKAKERGFTFGGKKGIYQDIFSEKVTMSDLFVDWAKATSSLKGAPQSVQAEMLVKRGQMKELLEAAYKARAMQLVLVYAKGFSISSAEGPGSMAIDSGEPLFSAAHPLPIVGTGVTQSNLITGAFTDAATRVTKLKAGLDLLRNMKYYTGPRVLTNKATPYKLMVCADEYGAWREALNQYSKFDGTGTNSNKMTYFVGEYEVVVEVMPYLNDYDAELGTIGNGTMCFLQNPVYTSKADTLKCYSVSSTSSTTTGVSVSNFEEEDPKSFVSIVRDKFGADHYGAELGIVGFTGA